MKAFFLGLIRQKSPEEMAEDKKLHLVEISKYNNYFPNVIASPKECRKAEEIPKDEILDFSQYCFDVRNYLIAEYGEIRSFLADKYPECKQYRLPKNEEEET
ncbi:hypothetical protein NQ317_001756 [Molorchus minor]|uniref:Uncharacterized protein n=1 Tax=Molorchus minor TaxID=1323400 RepID=A0ABQ9JHT1_9CUCU|nr:hypothetical protein NQ317_001756 [Molorchus minor]